MKKSLFFFAAAALALTACTNDDDALQTGQVQNSNRAVAFDTYTAGTTRAGEPEGVMTTDKLKTSGKGFGVFAFYHDGTDWAGDGASLTPNFMYNEHVSWSGGWGYSPLKYWPNETTKDSQDPNATAPALDKLSFFAYAPYINPNHDGTMITALPSTTTNARDFSTAETQGIISISRNTVTGDPLVEWACPYGTGGSSHKNSILDENVDLLWGVAAKDADYTAVNGELVNTEFGKPLVDLVKPNKEQKVKFLFQHALSRVGLTVVSAIDQIAGGDDGGKYNNAQTRVLIEDVTVWGDFGMHGVLDLNNETANRANWKWASVNRTASTETDPILYVDATNGYLATDLRYDASITAGIEAATPTNTFSEYNEGVLPSEKKLLAGGPDPSKLATGDALKYEFGKILYTPSGSDFVRATTEATEAVDAYTVDGSGVYTQVFKTSAGSKVSMNGTTHYWKIEEGSAINPDGSTVTLNNGDTYYVKSGTAGNYVYTPHIADGTEASGAFYSFTAEEISGSDYSGICYTSLMPRYFMVIPSKYANPVTDDVKTTVNVKITYRVITKDDKLNTTISNVQNVITKTEKFFFESGKSYNLKLILGLTTVKLDATVGEWQVGDDAEIWLPKNVE